MAIIICLVVLADRAASQNIYTALHLNQNAEYKTRRPQKIIETNTFYNKNGKEINKNVKTFDASGMILIEERYNEDEQLTARLTYVNDTLNKLKLARIFERWTKIGYSKETDEFVYDSARSLTRVNHKNANNELRGVSLVHCDGKGYPIELDEVSAGGKLIGKETAVYLFDKNKVVTTVMANNGNTLSTDTIKINFQLAYRYPGTAEIYNDHGDITKWTSRNFDKTETNFEKEYVYDNFGNILQETIFQLTTKKNGRQKREIDRLFRKEYVY